MGSRLSDTDKWKNPWFRSLPGKYKLLFTYMIDECDNAGVMHLDIDLISFVLKEEIKIEEVKLYLQKQIVFIAPDKIVIKNFITHQKNKNNVTMQKNIAKLIEKHGLVDRFYNGEFG